MKNGANYKDRNNIKDLAEAGMSAQDISVKLRIAPSCVASFMPGAKKTAAKKTAAKKTAAPKDNASEAPAE